MTTERVLPHDLTAEARLLGSILVRPERLVTARDLVRVEDFYRDAHARVFAAYVAVWDAGRPLGLDTLVAQLTATGDLERVGGIAYLATMDRGLATGDVEAPAAVIRQCAQRRAAIAHLERLTTQAWDTGTDTEELLAAIGQASSTLEQGAALDAFTAGAEVLTKANDAIEAMNAGRIGVTTGYATLDHRIGGYAPGQFVVIGARPGMGKSAFITSALSPWLAAGLHVGLVSLEMDQAEVGMRWFAAEASVNMLRARRRLMTESDYHRIGVAGEQLYQQAQRLHVSDLPYLSLPRIRAMARTCAAQHGLDLLVIDYLQLLESDGAGRRDENRTQEVGRMSRGMKLLAKELHIPVICLAQLNRQNEARQNKRPQLSDLRESGSIEQDADIVMFLHRDEVYDATDDNAGRAELIIAKGRNLPLGTVPLHYVKEFTRFECEAESGAA